MHTFIVFQDDLSYFEDGDEDEDENDELLYSHCLYSDLLDSEDMGMKTMRMIITITITMTTRSM